MTTRGTESDTWIHNYMNNYVHSCNYDFGARPRKSDFTWELIMFGALMNWLTDKLDSAGHLGDSECFRNKLS